MSSHRPGRGLALHALLASLVGLAGCSSANEGAGGASTTATANGTATNGTSTAATGNTTAGGTASTGASSGSGMPIGCLTDVSAGHHKVSCDGAIDYDVEIPEACTQGACGLIVDLHGYTMTADQEDKNTGMRARGQQNGYVIVQPTAPKDAFQYPSWDQATHIPLVYAFLHDLAASLPIDPKRVHAMGFSQGGGMTFRLSCTHANFFASVAPGAALYPGCEFSGSNKPSEEVDILQMHGHQDGILSFNAQAVPARDAVLNGGWTFGAPAVFANDAKHKATRWTTTNGTVFELWEHDYQSANLALLVPIKGHCVPGGGDFMNTPAGYSCDDQNTFVFGQIAMQFFIDHPKS